MTYDCEAVKECLIKENKVVIQTMKLVRKDTFHLNEKKISTPEQAAHLMRPFFEDSPREMVFLLLLNTAMHPIGIEKLFVGSLTACQVEPREILISALHCNAYGFLLFHNHVSGECEPSQSDIRVTKRLDEAGKLMGIFLLDHLIFGTDDKFESLKNRRIF